MRKLIEFDDETFYALTQLGRERMATIQDLADEAIRDLLKKHNVPGSLREALKQSATHEKNKLERDSAQGVARKQTSNTKKATPARTEAKSGPAPVKAKKGKHRKTAEGQREMLFPIGGKSNSHDAVRSRKSK